MVLVASSTTRRLICDKALAGLNALNLPKIEELSRNKLDEFLKPGFCKKRGFKFFRGKTNWEAADFQIDELRRV